jgi:cation:H+ antiporter
MAGEATTRRHAKGFIWIFAAMAVGFPGIILRVLESTAGYHLGEEMPQIASLIYGISIMGAAFILSWAAEAAQKDISAAFAIAILALIAILPEYTVEAFLAWDAGANLEDKAAVGRLAANVTGSNRLLIGLGWSLVAIVFWFRVRGGLVLPAKLTREIAFLTVATLLVFLVFFMKAVVLPLGILLIVLYVVYLILSSRAEAQEPDLAGPSQTLGNLPKFPRRIAVLFLFLYSAGSIFAAVEPFVYGLVETGRKFGIEEFYLIQWLAPLASESPEMVVALFYTARANPAAGITVLISAGVNQMTVLIGTMPVIYSISAGQFLSVPLGPRQAMEFFLTASLSLMAVLLITRRRLHLLTALLLLGTFITGLVFFTSTAHRVLASVYLIVAAGLLIKDPWRIWLLGRYVRREMQDLYAWLLRRKTTTEAGADRSRSH